MISFEDRSKGGSGDTATFRWLNETQRRCFSFDNGAIAVVESIQRAELDRTWLLMHITILLTENMRTGELEESDANTQTSFTFRNDSIEWQAMWTLAREYGGSKTQTIRRNSPCLK